MINLSVNIKLDAISKEVNYLVTKQIPYAAQLALNNTVYESSVYVKKTMPYFIQGGPIPFTARGVQYIKAKSKRDLRARVYIPDAQWKYMRWVVDGGDKRWTRSKHGIGKPIYENTRFNKYGNIPGRRRKEGVWRDLLNSEMPPRGKLPKGQFVGTVKGITGLWARLGKDGRTKLKLLVMFDHKSVHYRKSFPFAQFVNKFAPKHFRKEFNQKLTQVVKREAKKLYAR